MNSDRTSAPADSELVRLFNKTEGSFTHELVLADTHKTKIKYVLPPMAFARVAPEVAKKWLEMFPLRITTDTEAHASVNAAQAVIAEKDKEIAALKAQLAAGGKKGGKGEKKDGDSVI